MYKLVPLLALLAVPAAAQNAPAWSVSSENGVCTAVQSVPDAESGRLRIAYDAARQEVTLTSANHVESALPDNGTIRLTVVFLDNGRNKWDDQWMGRDFTFSRIGDEVHFATRFAGKKNVDQILTDLAGSSRIGFRQKDETIIAYFLDGLAPSIAQLKACASRAARPS